MVKFRPLPRKLVGQAKYYMVGVAQLAERIPVEDEVAGSFPVAHPENDLV